MVDNIKKSADENEGVKDVQAQASQFEGTARGIFEDVKEAVTSMVSGGSEQMDSKGAAMSWPLWPFLLRFVPTN